MLDRRDWECVKAHGIDPEAVEAQLVGFREGFPYLDVVRPASVGDGILRLDDSRLATLGRRYDRGLRRMPRGEVRACFGCGDEDVPGAVRVSLLRGGEPG